MSGFQYSGPGATGATGAAGASAQVLRATFATTTILAGITPTQFYTRPQNDSNYPDITAGVAVIAPTASGTPITAGDGTNYKSIVITIYNAAGTLQNTATIPISTGALNNATGSVAANGSVTVALVAPISIAGGYSVQIGLTAVGLGLVTPALSVTLGV